MQKQLRKQRDSLMISGTGVIAFGAWSVLRSIVYFATGVREIQSSFPQRFANDMTIATLYVLLFAFLTFDLSLRVYVGLCARSEGRGKSAGIAYLVVACILISSYLYSVPQDIIVFTRGNDSLLNLFASLFIDLTSLLTLILLLYSAVRSRRIAKTLSEGRDAA